MHITQIRQYTAFFVLLSRGLNCAQHDSIALKNSPLMEPDNTFERHLDGSCERHHHHDTTHHYL